MMLSRPVLVVLTVLAVVTAYLPLPAIVPACIILAFFALVPGAVCCRLLGFDAIGAFGWTVVIGTSFALGALLNEALLYAHIWTPTSALLVTVLLAAIGLVVPSSRDRATSDDVQPFGGPSAR